MHPFRIDSTQYTILLIEESADFSKAAAELELGKFSKLFLLVDENTEHYCLPTVYDVLPELKKAHVIRIHSGEANKTLQTCEHIWNELVENGADRHSLLINLGGGVIGDMGGFCASTYMRGIEFLQIPTTLLSMVDASAGGKTGIDFNLFKNMIGVFSNPIGVLIYPKFLKTLSDTEFNSGMAEVYKHFLLSEPEKAGKQFPYDPIDTAQWPAMIMHSVEFKNHVVKADFREQGTRKILNLGHTVGHAIEALSHQKGKPIPHGYAVAAGLVIEAYISVNNNSFSQRELDLLIELVDSTFPRIEQDLLKLSELEQYLFADKKNKEGKIKMVLLERIGKPNQDATVELHEIQKAIQQYIDLA